MKLDTSKLTVKNVVQILKYSKRTGRFTWKCHIGGTSKKDQIAGCINSSGYVVLRIYGILYYAHRLAWLYVYGVWPEHDVDHINHNTTDNRIENLRDVTASENLQNRDKAQSNNKLGLLGVCFDKREGKFLAQIEVDKKNINLGYFSTAKIAHNVYLRAKRKYHNTCTI